MSILFVSVLITLLLLKNGTNIRLNIGQSCIYFWMLKFVVLIQTALWSIWFRTCLNTTSIISIYFVSISAHSFSFLIILVTLTEKIVILKLLKDYFVFAEALRKVISFVNNILDLGGECNIREVKSAVFVIVSLLLIAVLMHIYAVNSLSSSKVSIYSVK